MTIPRKTRSRPVWGRIQLDAIDYISKIALSAFDRGLLLLLVGLAKYNGMIYSSQREIADYAGTHQANVSQAIKRLIASGLLHQEDKALRIDPLFCQFGNGDGLA